MSSSSPPHSPASRPIPITTHHSRARSGSLASIPALSTSPTSPVLGSLQTPTSISGFSARFTGTGGPDSPTSPLGPSSPLSYLLSGAAISPSKNGYPFGSKPLQSSAVDETEESSPPRATVNSFHRRASTTATNWGPGATTAQTPGSGITNDRAAGVLRRFSLSGVLQRPGNLSPPKESPRPLGPAATVPIIVEPKPRRSKAPKEPIKRGISPMGERLLKGHFDGFI